MYRPYAYAKRIDPCQPAHSALSNMGHYFLCFVYFTHIPGPLYPEQQWIPWQNGFNPFPNKPLFLHVCTTSLFKRLWEKEKLQRAISPFPTVFSTGMEIFLPFSSNLKL